MLLVLTFGTAISTALVTVLVTVSTMTSWRTWRQVNGVRPDPRDHPASGFQDRWPRRTTPLYKSGAVRFPQEPLFRAALYTYVNSRERSRGLEGHIACRRIIVDMEGKRPAGNICVTWGAFRGCGPVRPFVCGKEPVIATSSDAAVVCMPGSRDALRYHHHHHHHHHYRCQNRPTVASDSSTKGSESENQLFTFLKNE